MIEELLKKIENEIEMAKNRGRNKILILSVNIDGNLAENELKSYYNAQNIAIEIKKCKRGTYDFCLWW